MEVILFDKENSKYNRDADLLAQFFNKLREKFPQITIEEYSGDSIQRLDHYIDIDSFDKGYPVFILNGNVVSSSKIPEIRDIEKFIEEDLF
jgi:hypothetical protein